MSSFGKQNPITFYFVSIISFVLANVIREQSVSAYYLSLMVGVIFFFLGLYKRVNSKK
jgi:MFS superfamily sulfate permease-like transporter